jgi:MFS family permease
MTASGPQPSAALCMRSLVILSLSFLFAFTAFSGVQNLESSLDLGEVKGTVAVAIIYIVFTVACVLGPTMVDLFGAKLCILIQEMFFAVFMACQLFPRLYTVYPAAVLVGLGASAMWVGQGDYLTYLAVQYARRKKMNDNAALGFFQGIFFGIFQLSQVFGNLISSLVLEHNKHDNRDDDDDDDEDKTPKSTVHKLFYVYLACIGTGAMLLLTIKSKASLQAMEQDHASDSLLGPDMPTESSRYSRTERIVMSLRETVKLLLTPKMLLLIPLFVANGLESGFVCERSPWKACFVAFYIFVFPSLFAIFRFAFDSETNLFFFWLKFAGGDFTSSVVKESLGESKIGFVMAVFGACNALSSVAAGKLSDKIGRPFLLCFAFICHTTCAIFLIFWTIKPNQFAVMFMIAAAWGVGDAIWNTVLSATLSGCFQGNTQGAFSNFKMWQSVGIAAAFFYSEYLSLNVKLYIMLSFLGVGIVCYGVNVILFKLEEIRAYVNQT